MEIDKIFNLIVSFIPFVIITVAASKIGDVFKMFHLPIITGALITGIFAGPFMFNMVSEEQKDSLNFINDLSLGIIAFVAGSELYLKELRNRLKSIRLNTIGLVLTFLILGPLIIYLISNQISFLSQLTNIERISFSVFASILFLAPSPSAAVAVISELRAKGSFTMTITGVIVLLDFLVILIFSLAFSFIKGTLYEQSTIHFEILSIFISSIISYFLGFFILGRLLLLCLKLKVNITFKKLIIVGLSYSPFLLSKYILGLTHLSIFTLHLEPLAVCITASFYVTNYTSFRTEYIKNLKEISPSIFLLFFVYTGISFDIRTFFFAIAGAFLFFLIRLFIVFIGALIGGTLANDPLRYRLISWMTYIPSGGISIGFAALVSQNFPSFGAIFSALIIAVIILNHLIGDPLFKWAIRLAGEDNSRAQSTYDGKNDAIIFGYEPQSLALARQLKSKGWGAKVVTLRDKENFDLPNDIEIISLPSLTKEAFDRIGLSKTEAIVCLLSDQENLRICELAFQHYGTRDLIVRLSDRSFYERFIHLNVKIVDPSTAMVSLMDHFVRSPQATSLLLGMSAGQDTRDLELLNPNLHGISLRDLRLPSDVIVLSVMRGGQSLISHGYTRLRVHDIVTVVGSVDSLDNVQFKFSG